MRLTAWIAIVSGVTLGASACSVLDDPSRQVGQSECGSDDVFLLGVADDAARVVCYRADDSFEHFGPQLPISRENAQSARIRVGQDAARVVVITDDAIFAGGGADWWPIFQGAHQADRVGASDGLELVEVSALVPFSETGSTVRPEVYSFAGERIFRAESSVRVSFGPKGSYFVVRDHCDVSIRGPSGRSRAVIEHECGSGEPPRVMRTFPNSILFSKDYSLRFRDLRGDPIEADLLDDVSGPARARYHIIGDEIVAVRDGELKPILPVSPEIDAWRVHGAVADRYAIVESSREAGRQLILVGPDGEPFVSHAPDVAEFEDELAWLMAGEASLGDQGGLFLYQLHLGSPGPAIPSEELAVDLIEVEADGRIASHRLWQSAGPAPHFAFLGELEAVVRLDGGTLYRRDLVALEDETPVAARYAFSAWAIP